jgi:hypothetical protein
MKGDYSSTYWCKKGKHEDLHTALQELIPDEGKVKSHIKNRALERFRIASNCYYDLYNNGLCNRARSFARVFGFGAFTLMAGSLKTGGYTITQPLIDRTEGKMDEIILAAYAEQSCEKLISHNEVQFGHWNGGKFTPCNKIHPGQLAQNCAKRLLRSAS